MFEVQSCLRYGRVLLRLELLRVHRRGQVREEQHYEGRTAAYAFLARITATKNRRLVG